MRQITLQVDEDKYERLVAFLELLDFVTVQSTDFPELPQWQKVEVSRRLERIKAGEESTKPWEDIKKGFIK